MFPITRIFTDQNGDSQFEDISIPLKKVAKSAHFRSRFSQKESFFGKYAAYDFDFQNAPQKQYIILLDGEIEIETSLGEKRKFTAGETLLVEDTEGKKP